MNNSNSRRRFIKSTGSAAVFVSIPGANAIANHLMTGTGRGGHEATGVSVIIDPEDPIAMSGPAQWAAKELEQALTTSGIMVQRCSGIAAADAGNLCIIVAGAGSVQAGQLLASARAVIEAVPEALGLVTVKSGTRAALLAAGHDERGLVYALMELADRVNMSGSPLSSLHFPDTIIERPANKVRGLNRLFVSEIEDKPWYNDREMWPEYLTMLVTQRFNKFNLSLGIGYDFLQNVTDAYFLFAYPFFLTVPGYNVHVPGLPDTERDHNLEMLKYISEQTVARGMQFQLGLWMHGHEWLNSPNANYTIEGLNKENHADYCRDAVRMLLKACPAIGGITFRVHGESGVNEGSYHFWKTIFEGVAGCGRPVSIDLHSKGIDQQMLDTALSVDVPITVSPKFWAEHLGLPYHQADIRPLEIPDPDRKASALMNLSAGSRSFTRYGYADLLKEDRKYEVVYRIWPGTQRLLLWGDPLTGAAQSRIFSFCGSAGAELMEPLSFKGRRGSGIPGSRCGYADDSLMPRWDWEKYLYSLRVFGRTLYNPDCDGDVWRRYLKKEFGLAAMPAEEALAQATRILPIVLTAHGASAANNSYWPEMYANMPIADAAAPHPYTDTPTPKVFGRVSPFDPQLFLTIDEFATEMLKGDRSGKYTPIETAQWLDDLADSASNSLAQLRSAQLRSGQTGPGYRRMDIDVTIQIGLGQFFAAKFRSGVLYAIYQQTGDRTALGESLKMYRQARDRWAHLARSAKDVYKSDISFGEFPFLRGHWLDRLPAIDEDISFMAAQFDKAGQPGAGEQPQGQRSSLLVSAIAECLARPVRGIVIGRHTPPTPFKASEPINIELTMDKPLQSVRLYYRHVNQAERYKMALMEVVGNRYHAVIPGDYTNSPYPLQYYFELKYSPLSASLYPGLGADRQTQPYFVIRKG